MKVTKPRFFFAVCVFFLIFGTVVPLAARADAPTFTVGWSVYAGWNPYFYMQKSGILKKWADKYGITIKVQRFAFCTYWRLKTDERPFEIDDFETLLLDEWDYVVDPRKIMAEMATKKLRGLGYEILDFEAFPR